MVGVRVALAPGVLALGAEHGAVVLHVLLDERGGALELGRDRTDLDLDRAPVVVALALGQAGRRACTGRSSRGR